MNDRESKLLDRLVEKEVRKVIGSSDPVVLLNAHRKLQTMIKILESDASETRAHKKFRARYKMSKDKSNTRL
jgi:hypothetical protein